MSRVVAQRAAYIVKRWEHWLTWIIARHRISRSKLAKWAAPDPGDTDRHLRAQIKRWLEPSKTNTRTCVSADSAWRFGEAIRRERPDSMISGIVALHAAGYFGECIALLIRLLDPFRSGVSINPDQMKDGYGRVVFFRGDGKSGVSLRTETALLQRRRGSARVNAVARIIVSLFPAHAWLDGVQVKKSAAHDHGTTSAELTTILGQCEHCDSANGIFRAIVAQAAEELDELPNTIWNEYRNNRLARNRERLRSSEIGDVLAEVAIREARVGPLEAGLVAWQAMVEMAAQRVALENELNNAWTSSHAEWLLIIKQFHEATNRANGMHEVLRRTLSDNNWKST